MNIKEFFDKNDLPFKDAYLSIKQISELYDTDLKNVYNAVEKLKKDKFISIVKIYKTNANKEIQAFNVKDTIKIGFRLRSDNALSLQNFAAELVERELLEMQKKLKQQQYQLDYFWDKSDQKDLYY